MRLRVVVLVALAAGCQRQTPTPRSLPEWEQFDFATRPVALADLKGLSGTDLARVRGIIFGKHGRVFEDTLVQRWLMPRPWYVPDAEYTPDRLNDRERANVEVVREAEARARPHIAPGDLVFFKDRPITVAMLGPHTRDEWDILEAEIPAIHGLDIDRTWGVDMPDDADTSVVYRWFRERYWYHPVEGRYLDGAEKEMTAVERANVDTIRVGRMRQYADRVEPETMDLLRNTRLTPSMIAHNTLYELRFLRNEIYARRGYRFSTPWLRETFEGGNGRMAKAWYHPRDDFRESDLTDVERANAALIRAREDELHERVTKDPLDANDVDGLTEDDARILRNEIFARHGYAFHDPKLAGYFATLSWYKPSGSFSEASLSDVERDNVKVLRDQEIHAKSGQRFLPEG